MKIVNFPILCAMFSRYAQDGLRWPQDASRWLQDGLKMAPKWYQNRWTSLIFSILFWMFRIYVQDGLRWPQDASRWLQDGFKMAPKCCKNRWTSLICSYTFCKFQHIGSRWDNMAWRCLKMVSRWCSRWLQDCLKMQQINKTSLYVLQFSAYESKMG